jgi:hypothetical protein
MGNDRCDFPLDFLDNPEVSPLVEYIGVPSRLVAEVLPITSSI